MLMRLFIIKLWMFCAVIMGTAATAQDLTVGTVTRAPFSQLDADEHTGFSIDLMNAIGEALGQPVRYIRYDSFSEMIDAVVVRDVDAAIANISITAEREGILDFSQPMFDGGVQVMLPADTGGGSSVLSALLTREFAIWAGAALALLLGGGALMWVFERGQKSWFDRPASEALFPSFWWALNLILNGGFEERMPNSKLGRGFAVCLVVASLFFVSIFVAQITASLTIEAISEQVIDLNDLDGRRVGTIQNSTTAAFLDRRGISYEGFDNLDPLLAAFDADQLDAVVFDGPILAFHASQSDGKSRVLDTVYRPERYGIAFPTGSDLREPVNQAILRLRENGVYQDLLLDWFGAVYRPN